MIDRVIELSMKHRAAVIVAAILLALLGWRSLARTPIDAIPDLSENQAIVLAEWPGRAPQEVEDQVTYPLSTQLQGLAGVKAVRAVSELGYGMVTVIFAEGTDPYFARSRILERIATVQALLPEGVVPTLAPDATALGQVFMYTLDGGELDPGALRAVQDFTVRYALASVEGVAEVASIGGFVRAWRVELLPSRLRARGVSFAQALEAVRRSNVAAGGSVLERDGAEVVVRGDGLVRGEEDLAAVVVAAQDGIPVRLRDVGRVTLGPEPRRGLLEKDGREAVGGIVVMRTGENPIALTERLRARIRDLASALPPGVRIVPFYERTRLVHEALGTLWRTLAEEMLVTALVVWLVLRHARSAVVIVATVPLAALATFIAMDLLGLTANIMSLAGIAISIGVLVDAGIVMTENAHARLHERFGAAPVSGDTSALILESAKEVGRPLFFSVLIMVLSFLPVFALSGMEGKMFRPLAVTKTAALLAVAVLAVTLVPALLPTFLRGRLRHERESFLVRSVADVYRPLLAFAMERPLLMGVLFAALLGLGVNLAGKLGREYMPPLDEGTILDMPVTVPTVSAPRAARDLAARDALLRSLPEVESVVGKAGRAQSALDPAPLDMVETVVNLRPKGEWPRRGLPFAPFEAAARAAIPGDEAEALALAMDASTLFDRAQRELCRWRMAGGEGGSGAEGGGEAGHGHDEERARLERAKGLDWELEDRVGATFRAALEEAARARGKDLRFPAPEGLRLERRTRDTLLRELDTIADTPGWSNIWTQPIVNRIDMLATGIRTQVGVKVFGPDTQSVQRAADEVAAALRRVPGAADVVADQVVGERYLEVAPDRESAARYGVDVQDVAEVVEAGLGGVVATTAIDGRARLPVRVRFARGELEEDDRLSRLPVWPRDGSALAGPVPLGAVATLRTTDGPSMIKSEDGRLRAYVQLNVRDRDPIGFVEEARREVAKVPLPAGVSLVWGGQFEHEARARATLAWIVPAVLAVIFVVLLWTYGDVADAGLILLAVPGAVAGGIAFQWLLGHRFSVATAVGAIVCFGLAVETGIVMLVYLREAISRRGGLESIPSLEALQEAIMEGAVQRLRPKLLTEGTTILGLVPMLFAEGTGAELLRPMAAPVLGGILVADEVIDLLLPVAFYRVRRARWLEARRAAGQAASEGGSA